MDGRLEVITIFGPLEKSEFTTESELLFAQPKHVVGISKMSSLNEHPKQMFRLMDKKIFTTFGLNIHFHLSGPMNTV